MHFDAGADKNVDELGRSEEIRLVRAKDVAARVAPGRIAEEAFEFLGAAGPLLEFRPAGLGRLDDFRCNGPAVAAAAFDRFVAHTPEVMEQVLAIARGVIEDPLVSGDGV